MNNEKTLSVQIINGHDVSQQETRRIMQIWENAFGKGEIIDKNKKLEFQKEEVLFITRKKNKEILSVGSLKAVDIIFSNKHYSIKGIGGVVSTIERKGYGKIVMQEIRKYLKQKNLMGIGFCTRKNNPFYKKCNFIIEKNLTSNFIKKTSSEKFKNNPSGDDDVLYFNDKYSLIQEIISSPKTKIYVPFWW